MTFYVNIFTKIEFEGFSVCSKFIYCRGDNSSIAMVIRAIEDSRTPERSITANAVNEIGLGGYLDLSSMTRFLVLLVGVILF